jgi:hypothetical protein
MSFHSQSSIKYECVISAVTFDQFFLSWPHFTSMTIPKRTVIPTWKIGAFSDNSGDILGLSPKTLLDRDLCDKFP